VLGDGDGEDRAHEQRDQQPRHRRPDVRVPDLDLRDVFASQLSLGNQNRHGQKMK